MAAPAGTCWPTPSERACGDSLEWGRLVPAAWQALADPAGAHPWPPAPDPAAERPGDRFGPAWWMPAVHVMLYSLGWSDPGRGLGWWYSQHKPTEDARLGLIDAMLGERSDDLVAWCIDQAIERNPIGDIGPGLVQRGPAADPAGAARFGPAWVQRVRDRAGEGAPISAGNVDLLHLAHHATAPEWTGDGTGGVVAPRLVAQRTARQAVLVVDAYAGWYAHLRELGAALASGPGRSWRVEVVCRPVGSFGVFRRSRLSGRWFAGPHHLHQVGLADPAAGSEP